MSRPCSSAWCCLNDSLTIRFSVFLDVDLRQCFFEIASPSLACCPPLTRQRTVNQLSRLRLAFSNTRANAPAVSNRLCRRNRNDALRDELGSNPDGYCAECLPGGSLTASASRGPWRGDASKPTGRPWSPYGRGSHACVRASVCWADTYVSCSCYLWCRTVSGGRPQKGRQGYARPLAVSIDAPPCGYSGMACRGKSQFGRGFLSGIDCPVTLEKPPALRATGDFLAGRNNALESLHP